jgi:antitoxin PrlF
MISYPMSMKTTLSERGQIVIPKPIRDRLGLKAGQVLECREERGQFVASKVAARDPIAAVYGVLKTTRRTNQWLDLLRGKAK